MSLDFVHLRIKRVIVHEVPQRLSGQDAPLVLSEIDSPLTPDLRNYFRERITESMTTGSMSIAFDNTVSSPVPEAIASFLRGDSSPGFVSISQDLAKHLLSCQTGANTSGLLVAVDATLDGTKSLAILKLEKNEGLRVVLSKHEGLSTFAIHLLNDLLFTERTRVYKGCLFWGSGQSLAAVRGLASDNQFPGSAIADFFLRRFLGCKLSDDPALSTQRFLELTEQFVNSSDYDPGVKAEYHIASLAHLSSQDPTVSPKRFAMQALRGEHRVAYLAHMEENGLTEARYAKDTSLIESQIRRMQADFASGIVMRGSPEAFAAHVSMTSGEDGKTRVEFEDVLKRLK